MMTSTISLIFIAVAIQLSLIAGQLDDQQQTELWTNYKMKFNKQYNADEDTYRRGIWTENVRKIQLHNLQSDLGQHSYTLGINQYSDWTFFEYRKFLLGYGGGSSRLGDVMNNVTSDYDHSLKYDVSAMPKTVDWRTKGYVTPVKNQKACGSCWAFSSTGSLEGQHFKKTGKLVSLSEQNLVDCTKSLGNMGCSGGWMNISFVYVHQNGGIDTEASYPYEGRDGECRYNPSTVGATCTGYKRSTPPGSESALQAAVAQVGPISVAIDADHESFMQYKSGVYDEPECTTMVDHAVLVVGYGTYEGKDYWLVKNSWDVTWGMEGYIMMSRNKRNQCAIANFAMYPTV